MFAAAHRKGANPPKTRRSRGRAGAEATTTFNTHPAYIGQHQDAEIENVADGRSKSPGTRKVKSAVRRDGGRATASVRCTDGGTILMVPTGPTQLPQQFTTMLQPIRLNNNSGGRRTSSRRSTAGGSARWAADHPREQHPRYQGADQGFRKMNARHRGARSGAVVSAAGLSRRGSSQLFQLRRPTGRWGGKSAHDQDPRGPRACIRPRNTPTTAVSIRRSKARQHRAAARADAPSTPRGRLDPADEAHEKNPPDRNTEGYIRRDRASAATTRRSWSGGFDLDPSRHEMV